MKRMNKLVAVLVALVLIVSTIPAAFAAGTTAKPGEQASVSFTAKNIYGLNGEFTFSNPSLISGEVSYTSNTAMMGSVQNNVAFFYGSAQSNITITVSFKVSASAKDGDKCDVTFKYETSDADGNMSSDTIGWTTKTETVTVKIPTEPTTEPTTKPTEPKPTTPKPTTPTTPKPTTPTTPKPTTPSATVDYTELNKQLALAEELKQDEHSAKSWETLQAAVKAAKEAKNSKDQKVVDAAAQALADAIKNLQKLDYTALEEAITKIETAIDSELLEGKFADLLEALTNAKELLGKADSQEAIDAAEKALKDALAALEEALAALGKEVEVEVEPSGDYCNISIHYVWPILFFISLAVNAVFVVLTVLYLRRKKKETDDTPLVNYDIADDAE